MANGGKTNLFFKSGLVTRSTSKKPQRADRAVRKFSEGTGTITVAMKGTSLLRHKLRQKNKQARKNRGGEETAVEYLQGRERGVSGLPRNRTSQ